MQWKPFKGWEGSFFKTCHFFISTVNQLVDVVNWSKRRHFCFGYGCQAEPGSQWENGGGGGMDIGQGFW